MRILVLGSDGQVGSALTAILQKKYQITTIGRKDLDCSNVDQVNEYFNNKFYDLIINAVAYTKVDPAEKDRQEAQQLNEIFPHHLAKIVKKMNSALIHYSTDYVFDGNSISDYFELSKPNPLNVYGKTKLLGDLAILRAKINGYILRVSWVYGNKDHSFLNKIQKQIQEKKPLQVVRDQIGTPTSATFIADITKKLIDLNTCKSMKIYNVSPKGKCSWFDFAKLYLQISKQKYPVSEITTEQINQRAQRPKSVKLNSSEIQELLTMKFPDWQEVLKEFLDER